MSEVKRYDPGCDYAGQDEMVESADGGYVKWKDYAALQQQLDAVLSKGMELAQEAAHVYAEYNKEMAPDVVCDGQTIQEFYDLANGWASVDAYLNSVRAEGADKVAEYHFVRIDALKEVSRQGHLFHKAAYSDAVNVANLFRAGKDGKDA
ncbi:hypothetical protein [Pantoea sp. PGP6]